MIQTSQPAKEAPEPSLIAGHNESAIDRTNKRGWIVLWWSFVFALLQSICTAVIAISAVRVAIGLSALAAAAGLHVPATGFHADIIRIPMMGLALAGSLVNLYIIWRIRRLRARPASQWRQKPVPAAKIRSENLQILLAVVTLALLAAEWITHSMIHRVP